MQTWSTGHRSTRDRSSSVVLLGKLSAIVRRGSVFQIDSENAHSSSNNRSSYDAMEPNRDDELKEMAGCTRRCSIGAIPPVQSNLTAYDALSSGSCQKGNGRAMIQRLQFYPAQPLGTAALAKPLSHDEFMRRTMLEGQIGDFSALHESFAPPSMALNDQEEKETVTEAEETCGYELDNNEQEIVDEEERKAGQGSEEDIAVEDALHCSFKANDEHDDEEDDVSVHSEELDFDSANMRMSVRKLMNRIKSKSRIDESGMHYGSAAEDVSNQDDYLHEIEDNDDAEKDVGKMNGLDELDLDDDNNNNDDVKSSSKQTELTQEMSLTENRSKQPAHRLSSGAEEALLSAHDQLTSSVRRLVIELRDDSDSNQMRKPLANSHGIRRKSMLNPLRRRAGSCSSTYDLSIPSPNDEGSSMPTSLGITPSLTSEDTHPSKKHKKSAFSRLGPRMLETLHLRKKRKTYLYTDEELETVEGARWKIVELAFRFGGKHRSYLVQAINMFFPMLKYGRRGGAHATRLHCNCCGTLQWQHKRGGLSEAVDLAEVLQVHDGRQTAVFRKYPSTTMLEACSFSVVFQNRTLDLETQSSSHRDWLVSAIRTLVAYARRQRCIEHQAIAERAILPLEDCLLLPPVPLVQSPSPSASSQANRQLDNAFIIAASTSSYKLRSMY
ncbi:unnamed protein product [Peronospora belbahrii]|uniref:PH domain-containing protein n=1 Tax=Peronospora belbahrii TaxID=622444 RepID=A0AAU9KVR7_9STRA|nr:unnamed protein product [Peronospora belbahrii]